MSKEEKSNELKSNHSLSYLYSDCSRIGNRIVGMDVDELKYMYKRSEEPTSLEEQLLKLANKEGVRAARVFLINVFCEFETLFYQKEIGRLLSKDEYIKRVIALNVGLDKKEIRIPSWFE